MWFLQSSERRKVRDDLGLGIGTSLVAGLVNVCSVMIFFAFSANVTGHVATFAEEIIKGHWHQVAVLGAWMSMFLAGAFVANLSITVLGPNRMFVGHGAPPLLQALVLAAVGYYGQLHYQETLRETEMLVGVLLFTMGLQNSTVTTLSNGVVRTTHLTGLFTDLAMELSMLLQPRFKDNQRLRDRFVLHVAILGGYMVGGIAGGWACQRLGFRAFYLGSAGIALLLVRDLWTHWQNAPERVASALSRTSRAP